MWSRPMVQSGQYGERTIEGLPGSGTIGLTAWSMAGEDHRRPCKDARAQACVNRPGDALCGAGSFRFNGVRGLLDALELMVHVLKA
jgi:hypothetical protein